MATTARSDSVLLVSHEPAETEGLRSFLASRGFAVHVTTGPSALHALALSSYDFVLADVVGPGVDGLALTRRALEVGADTRVLLIVHAGVVGRALEAVRIGAADYLMTPISPEELARKMRRLRFGESLELEHSTLVAESSVMKTVLNRAARASTVNLPVFLHGEPGTGRKTIARVIHRFGPSRRFPFLVSNLEAVPPHRLSSELFGDRAALESETAPHGVLGAAGRGAVYLDNIERLSSACQLELVGALDTGIVRPLGPNLGARIFSASSRNLDEMVAQGTLQNGLRHRLEAFSISIPPLRERREDIEALAEHLLRRYASESDDGRAPGITPEARAALIHYAWPGNVLELANVMERALALSNGAVRLKDLPPQVSSVTVRTLLPPRLGPPAG